MLIFFNLNTVKVGVMDKNEYIMQRAVYSLIQMMIMFPVVDDSLLVMIFSAGTIAKIKKIYIDKWVHYYWCQS